MKETGNLTILSKNKYKLNNLLFSLENSIFVNESNIVSNLEIITF